MGMFYELNGMVELHFDDDDAAQAIEEIIDEFETECGEITTEWSYNSDGTGMFSVSGGDYMSYGRAEELDEILKRLSPYVVKPCFFRYHCDEGDGVVFLGPRDKEEEVLSQVAFDEIQYRLERLTEEDRRKLTTILLKWNLDRAKERRPG